MSVATRVTGLADTRREAPGRAEPSQTAWGKAMAALAIKELYLLGFLEPLESAESPCQPLTLHLQPRMYRLQGGPEPLTHTEGLQPYASPLFPLTEAYNLSTRKYPILSCDAV